MRARPHRPDRHPYDRYWHKAAEHILIGDGRFRGEADMHCCVASTSSVADDPSLCKNSYIREM